MRWAAALLLAGVTAATAACTGAEGPPPRPSSVPSSVPPTTATLTAADPAAASRHDPQAQATGVRLEVTTIVNPQGQALALSVDLAADGATGPPVEVGRVSPYPSDRGGVFPLPLRDEGLRLARTVPVVLTVRVAPVAAGEALRDDVRVEVTVSLVT